MSAACCTADTDIPICLQQYILVTEKFQKDCICECSLLNYTMCTKLRVQNKTLAKINLNYLLITHGLVPMCKYTVVVIYEIHQIHMTYYGISTYINDVVVVPEITQYAHSMFRISA